MRNHSAYKKKRKRKKKIVDGYYFDGKKCITLYKENN